MLEYSAFHAMRIHWFEKEKEGGLNRFLFGNDVSLEFYSIEDLDSQWIWDFVFAKGQLPSSIYGRVWGDYKNESFLNHCDKYHWVFGKSQGGEISHLFVPGGVVLLGDKEKAKYLDSLEVLSFDPTWLTPRTPTQTRWVHEGEGIPTEILANLKRLDFGAEIGFLDLDFLKQLKRLEHLTIRYTGQELIDVAGCQTLKTLVWFGPPGFGQAANLNGLPSIEQVTFVGEFQPAEIQAIENVLTKPTLSFVTLEDYSPEPPEKFKRHVEERRKAILKKYVGEQ